MSPESVGAVRDEKNRQEGASRQGAVRFGASGFGPAVENGVVGRAGVAGVRDFAAVGISFMFMGAGLVVEWAVFV